MAANGNNRSGFFVRHRWLLWAVGIVGAVVLLASFMSHDDAVPIRSATVQPGTIRSIVSTNGKVEALRRLQQQGAASRGEVKAAENQLAGAEADLKFLQQKQKDRYSKPEVARVQAQENEAQSAYAAAEDILSKLNVRAPFDGIV